MIARFAFAAGLAYQVQEVRCLFVLKTAQEGGKGYKNDIWAFLFVFAMTFLLPSFLIRKLLGDIQVFMLIGGETFACVLEKEGKTGCTIVIVEQVMMNPRNDILTTSVLQVAFDNCR